MLRTSTKNVAHEVVSCLIESNGRGVLTEIIKWLTTSQQNLLRYDSHKSILDQTKEARKVLIGKESTNMSAANTDEEGGGMEDEWNNYSSSQPLNINTGWTGGSTSSAYQVDKAGVTMTEDKKLNEDLRFKNRKSSVEA